MTLKEKYLKETGAKTIWKIPNRTFTDEYLNWIRNYIKTSNSIIAKTIRQLF